jgi:hypothetical protein
MNAIKLVRRLAPLVVVAFAAGAIAAHADGGGGHHPAARLIVPATSAPPSARPVPCKFTARPPAPVSTPPSQALLDAFAILRRERRPEDALPAEALNALKRRNLAPVSPESARLLRTGARGGRAWVVPVPDVSAAFPFPCVTKGKRTADEGLAVVAVGGAAAGGGGALDDLVRGRAAASVDPCAGDKRDMLSVSGIVPNGVASVFLTAPDGTAVRADVKDNGYEFLIPRSRRLEQRYVVWTGGDGTPHVQPVTAMALVGRAACARIAAVDRMPRVTPVGFAPCAVSAPVPLPAPLARSNRRRVVPVPPRVVWDACPPQPALVVPNAAPIPVPKAPRPK